MSSKKKKFQRVFIVPTYSGLILGMGSFGLFFYSFLYGYGPSYVLSIVLITFFLAIGFMSNNNIRDIELDQRDVRPIEAAENSIVSLGIKNLSKEIKLSLKIEQIEASSEFSVKANSDDSVGLKLYFPKRGVYENTSIRLYSKYPLGLFYCWRVFKIESSIYVYPIPKSYKIDSLAKSDSSSHSAPRSSGTRNSSEEFSRLKDYESGDPISRIDWKRLAKNDELLVKLNDGDNKSIKHIKWESIVAEDFETKLSYISFLIIYFAKENFEFKLSLPNFISVVGRSDEHKKLLLSKLASLNEGDF